MGLPQNGLQRDSWRRGAAWKLSQNSMQRTNRVTLGGPEATASGFRRNKRLRLPGPQAFVKPLSEPVACLIPLVASRPGRMTSGPPTPGKIPDDGTISVFMWILRQSPCCALIAGGSRTAPTRPASFRRRISSFRHFHLTGHSSPRTPIRGPVCPAFHRNRPCTDESRVPRGTHPWHLARTL